MAAGIPIFLQTVKDHHSVPDPFAEKIIDHSRIAGNDGDMSFSSQKSMWEDDKAILFDLSESGPCDSCTAFQISEIDLIETEAVS